MGVGVGMAWEAGAREGSIADAQQVWVEVARVLSAMCVITSRSKAESLFSTMLIRSCRPSSGDGLTGMRTAMARVLLGQLSDPDRPTKYRQSDPWKKYCRRGVQAARPFKRRHEVVAASRGVPRGAPAQRRGTRAVDPDGLAITTHGTLTRSRRHTHTHAHTTHTQRTHARTHTHTHGTS